MTHPGPIPIEDLLAHQDWLTRLARSLVADPASADDVVQDVWVQAIEAPPAHNQNLRGWLARVVRRTASKAGRSSRARHRREAANARPDTSPSTHDLVEQMAVQRDLASQLVGMEEPYRTTLLLRYIEGLPIGTVAQRMGVPLNTARSRLSRGLERLRGALDRTHGPRKEGRAAWVGMLAPIAQRPLSGEGALPSLTAITSSTSTILAVTMPIKVLGGLAAIALLALSAWWLWPAQPSLPSTEQRAGSAGNTAGANTAATAVGTTARSADRSSASDAALAASAGDFLGVLLSPTLQPLPGLRVRALSPRAVRWQGGDLGWISDGVDSLRIQPETETKLRTDAAAADTFFSRFAYPAEWRATVLGAALPQQESETDSSGQFARPASVKSDATPTDVIMATPGWTIIARPAPSTDESSDALIDTYIAAPAVRVTGTVLDEAGTPIGAAAVAVDPRAGIPFLPATATGRPLALIPAPFSSTNCNSGGEFTVRSAPACSGTLLRATAPGYRTALVPVPNSDTTDLVIVLAPAPAADIARVDGVVLDPQGQPLTGATLFLDRAQATSGADGEFALEFGSCPSHAALTVIAKGFEPLRWADFGARVASQPGRQVTGLRVQLAGPARTVRGTVSSARGTPAAGWNVNLFDATTLLLGFTTAEARSGGRDRMITTDDQGRFALSGLSQRPYRLRVWNPTTGAMHIAGPFAPILQDLDIRLPADLLRGDVRGRVRNADGAPLAGVRVAVGCCHFVTAGGGAMWDFTTPVLTDAEGRFTLADVPQRGAWIAAEAPAGDRLVLPVEDLDGTIGTAATSSTVTLDLVLTAESPRYLTLHTAGTGAPLVPFELRNAAGEPMPFEILRGNRWETVWLGTADTATAPALCRHAADVAEVVLHPRSSDPQILERPGDIAAHLVTPAR